MKKIIISLEILLLILFIGFGNADAYISGMGPMVYMHIYNEDMTLDEQKTVSINVAKDKFELPEKEEYTFDGWYYDTKLTKKVKNNSIDNFSYSELDNLHLYGRWVPANNNLHHIIFGSLIGIALTILGVITIILSRKYKHLIKKLRP